MPADGCSARRTGAWSGARSIRESAEASRSWNGGDDLAEHFGEYVALDRPRRLGFDFWTGFGEERTRVAVTITPDGEGALLILTHEGVWADWEEKTRQGWTMILDGLARTIET